MNVIHSAREWRSRSKRVSLAIGFFDGVHLGHQQVIRQAVSDAGQHEGRAVVVTFDRHPSAVVAPERTPPLIYSLPQKLRAIETAGAETLLLFHFDEAFSRQSGEEFVRALVRGFERVESICVGSSFKFGYRRSGNVDLLQKLGRDCGFAVHGLAAVSLDGQMVSSTRIRQAVQLGQLDAAGQMLGRPYSLAGTVVAGDRLGQKLGFPTANLDLVGRALPPSGVYAVRARVEQSWYRAVLNIGYRPTLDRPQSPLRVEAHLLDFEGRLYGLELELAFLEKLRDEMKFSSLETLQKQIARDVDQARVVFARAL
jgi:riboflavin kinase / FMN adenylyltransferase